MAGVETAVYAIENTGLLVFNNLDAVKANMFLAPSKEWERGPRLMVVERIFHCRYEACLRAYTGLLESAEVNSRLFEGPLSLFSRLGHFLTWLVFKPHRNTF